MKLIDPGALARGKDLAATTVGLFGELSYDLSVRQRLIAGLRHDRYEADRYSPTSGAAMGIARENLSNGFVRPEKDLADLPATAYGNAEEIVTSGRRARRPERRMRDISSR